MAIDIVTVPKPQIHLVGDIINNEGSVVIYSKDDFGMRVDHARTLSPTATTTISGVTLLDKNDILTFNGSVRVIITGLADDKPVYARQTSSVLDSLTFEGPHKQPVDYVSKNSETWYTYNGKDPVRSAAYLYTFRDETHYVGKDTNPSAESNINTLGFVLRNSPTGNELITIKAKTYHRGKESNIAIATFKIASSHLLPI